MVRRSRGIVNDRTPQLRKQLAAGPDLFSRERRRTVVDKLGDHAWYRQVANSPRTDPESASVKPFAIALTPGSSSKISQLLANWCIRLAPDRIQSM
jgi:hypothetical protein